MGGPNKPYSEWTDAEILQLLPTSDQDQTRSRCFQKCKHVDSNGKKCTTTADSGGLCGKHICEEFRKGRIRIDSKLGVLPLENSPDRLNDGIRRPASAGKGARSKVFQAWELSDGDETPFKMVEGETDVKVSSRVSREAYDYELQDCTTQGFEKQRSSAEIGLTSSAEHDMRMSETESQYDTSGQLVSNRSSESYSLSDYVTDSPGLLQQSDDDVLPDTCMTEAEESGDCSTTEFTKRREEEARQQYP